WSPHEARDEIRRIDEDVFKLALLAASMMVGAGADLAAVRAVPAFRGVPREQPRFRGENPRIEPGPELEKEALQEGTTELREESAGIAEREAVERGALEQGGFAKGMKPEEISKIHEDLGGPGAFNGDPSAAIAAASRQNGFWNKAGAIVREIAGRHMFHDANKRTALAVVRELMERNGI